MTGRSIVGDLHEDFVRRSSQSGLACAEAWYRREALGVIWRGALRRLANRRLRSGLPGQPRKGDGMAQRWLEEFKQALRSLLRSPGFTLAATLTLSLGIGSSAAIFSVVNGILVDPLPFEEPGQLVTIRSTAPGVNAPPEFGVSPEFSYYYLREAEALQDSGVYKSIGATLRFGEVAERLRMAEVSLSLVTTLRSPPALGSFPTSEELTAGLDAVLISDSLWKRRFGADPAIVGKTVDAADRTRTIVGVMSPDFRFPEDDTDIWFLFVIDPQRQEPGDFSWELVARVQPGTDPQGLLSQVVPIADRMREVYASAPSYVDFLTRGRFRPVVHSLRDQMVGDLGRPLLLVLATVLVVWMVACANVANLFFVRAEVRQHEMAVRSALGAGRGRLIRVFGAEALLLAGAGGAIGCVLAWAAVPLLVNAAPPGVPRLSNVDLDLTSLGFAAGVSLASALLFGLMPALRYSSSNALGQVHSMGIRSTAGRRRQWARGGLVIAQSGMAMVLLVCSGLLMQSFQQLASVDPGFESEGLLTFQTSPPREDYPSPTSLIGFHHSLMERLAALPGVESVGAVRNLPIDESAAGSFFEIEGAATAAGAERPLIYFNFVTPGYFEAMKIKILAGRGFRRSDEEDRVGQTVISRSVAEKYWPGQDPIGKRLRFSQGIQSSWETVVGVVDDVRDVSLRESPRDIAYFPFIGAQGDEGWGVRSPAYVLRAHDAASLAPLVREEIRRLDSVMPVYRMQMMEEVVARSVVRLSFALLALGISAAMALALGSIGLYGVLSYVVSQRTQEIGIRMALGARAGQVRRMVVAQGVGLGLIGVAAGLLAAAGLTRVLRDLLYGTSPLDPVIFAGTASVMIVVSLLACFMPARRACSVDPARSLRLD